jgi:Xaa-Pro aminopeptidase
MADHNPTSPRLQKLRRSLRKTGAEAILVTSFPNVTYLTGFTGDDSYLLVTDRDQILLSDMRYTTQLEEECPGIDLEIRPPGVTMLQRVSRVISRIGRRRIALEADCVSVAFRDKLAAELPQVHLCSTSGLVEELRQIKDRQEVQEIRRSVDLAQRAFAVVRAGLRPEQTEKSIAAELEYQIRRFGGRGCSFPSIVAVGPRAALPHATPTDRQVGESDFVLIDWGAFGGLYASDLTRVLATGRISPKLERIYRIVLTAQQRAIDAIRPGVQLSEVDAAARTVISKAGYGRQFGHGLGHGIGLQIHEAPRLAANQDQLLRAGMVITIEPGIYLPGWGGVRIEDDVLVTRTGHQVLSDLPKELENCVVA